HYGEALLKPTRIYVADILAAIKKFNKRKQNIVGIAHITGGSFYDKVSRILPKDVRAVIDTKSWAVPEIFEIIWKKGKVPKKEIYKTLNMGIGMVLISKPAAAKELLRFIKGSKIIGTIEKGDGKVELI
ncbi:MAG: phosphoribosylformylglycinamidine cyclo-ligase, partial [Elusimicrobiota bacterium]|nr:phosphoribosylformylglycinamidine cyclo-ligase [Elusimicrobiota bacterium]